MEFLVCPLYTFIISQRVVFVNRFLKISQKFFLSGAVNFKATQVSGITTLTHCGVFTKIFIRGLRPYLPLSVYLLYHTLWYLSRGFSKVFEKFFQGYQPFRGRFSLTRPFDIIIIPQTPPKVKMAKYTNLGKIIAESLSILPIDFLRGVWYNGKFGRAQSRPGRAKVNWKNKQI